MEDLFDSRWFNKTKLFVSIIGQWPFQRRWIRNSIRAMYHVLMWSAAPSMIRAFYLYWMVDKLVAVVLCFPALFTLLVVTIKYNHYTINQVQTKLLFERVRSDWSLITEMEPESRAVLEKYAGIGRATVKFYSSTSKYIMYAVLCVDIIVVIVSVHITRGRLTLTESYIYLSLAIFLSAPNVTRILNIINPLNESRQTRLLFPMDYGENGVNYHNYIMLHSSFATFLVINIFVACESVYMPLVFHCCGLFAVVSDRLERASTHDVLNNIRKLERTFESHDDDMVCLRRNEPNAAVLASCVKLHNRAIWYAGSLNAYYTNNFLIVVTMNMIMISVTGLQLALQIGELEEIIAAAIYLLAQLLHLFFLSLPGQFLMDCSETVRESAYNFPWYNLESNTQKLLIMIIIRSMKPSVITAGSFFVLKIETFSGVLQTSMSYLTVLSSFY